MVRIVRATIEDDNLRGWAKGVLEVLERWAHWEGRQIVVRNLGRGDGELNFILVDVLLVVVFIVSIIADEVLRVVALRVRSGQRVALPLLFTSTAVTSAVQRSVTRVRDATIHALSTTTRIGQGRLRYTQGSTQ